MDSFVYYSQCGELLHLIQYHLITLAHRAVARGSTILGTPKFKLKNTNYCLYCSGIGGEGGGLGAPVHCPGGLRYS